MSADDEDKALAHFLAERLMGWELSGAFDHWLDKGKPGGRRVAHMDDWSPAVRDEHAMMVARAMRERGWEVCMTLFVGGAFASRCGCEMRRTPRGRIIGRQGDALPRAIAEAARAALEGEAEGADPTYLLEA